VEHVRLGTTGLKVSRLCLGGMVFGGQCDEATSLAILDRAAEAGITFLDTAAVHPMGADYAHMGDTERLLGRWLDGRREQFVVATKCTGRVGPLPWQEGSSRKHIIASAEAALRRLRTDYIDLYQFQYWDPDTPIDESLGAMDDLVRSGKVRYVGCSNFATWRIARALGRSEALGVVRLVSAQPRYNLLYRNPERDLFPLCAEEGLGLIPYNPLGGGFLTGRYQTTEAVPGGSRFTGAHGSAIADLYRARYWHDGVFETVAELTRLADQAGLSMPRLALAWVLAQPAVTAPLVGASRVQHLDDIVAACDVVLDADLYQRLDELTRPYVNGETDPERRLT
jgi:1-deoxyxylulose-5-phosphate synthase